MRREVAFYIASFLGIFDCPNRKNYSQDLNWSSALELNRMPLNWPNIVVLNLNCWVWLTRLYLLGLKPLDQLTYLPILKTVNKPSYLWKTHTKYRKNLFILWIYLANESKSSLNLYSTIKQIKLKHISIIYKQVPEYGARFKNTFYMYTCIKNILITWIGYILWSNELELNLYLK